MHNLCRNPLPLLLLISRPTHPLPGRSVHAQPLRQAFPQARRAALPPPPLHLLAPSIQPAGRRDKDTRGVRNRRGSPTDYEVVADLVPQVEI